MRPCPTTARRAGLLAFGLLLGSACTSNRAPVFEPIEDLTVSVGDRVQFPVRAFDRDGDAVRYGARGLPAGSRFDRDVDPPLFEWTPLASDAAPEGLPHTLTFLAADGDDARSAAYVIITVHPRAGRPRFTSPAAHVLDLSRGDQLDVLVTARKDDAPTLHFELVEAPDGVTLQPRGKEARLTWRPNPRLIGRQRVFGVTIRAWARDRSADALQTVTVVLLDD